MSATSLVNEIKNLPESQFDFVLNKLLVLRARMRPSSPSGRERVLLAKIMRGAPEPLLQEYRALIEKRRRAGLSALEQERVISVADELEAFNVRWLRWVSELAKLRNTTLAKLAESLELPARPYV